MHSHAMENTTTTTNPAQAIHRHKLALNTDEANQGQFLPVVAMLPPGFRVVSMQPTKGIKDSPASIEIYTLVNPNAESEPRNFKICRTGEVMPHCGNAVYHATWAIPGMPALHLFELL